jgi:hypothetical protein
LKGSDFFFEDLTDGVFEVFVVVGVAENTAVQDSDRG